MKLTKEQIEKRRKFEEVMRKHYPPEKFPQLWIRNEEEAMKNLKMCKCGICEDDCEYHKPEEEKKNKWWRNIGFASRDKKPTHYLTLDVDWKAPEGVEYVIIEGWGGGGGGSQKKD